MPRNPVELTAHAEGVPEVETSDPRTILRLLPIWHEEYRRRSWRQLVLLMRSDGSALFLVGLGDRRGVYLWCNYGPESTWDLYAVGPKGLRGRREIIEYVFEGGGYDVPVQCLMPLETALPVVEFFLRYGAVSLAVEWVADTGISKRFLKR